jgi:hypothetical protein
MPSAVGTSLSAFLINQSIFPRGTEESLEKLQYRWYSDRETSLKFPYETRLGRELL